MKIVLIIDSLSGGGAEHQLMLLANSLSDEHDTTIYCLSKDAYIKNEFQSMGIPIKYFGIDNLFTIKGLKEWYRMMKMLKAEKPDVVQTQLFSSDLSGLSAAIIAGVKRRISARRDMGFWQKWHHKIFYGSILNTLCTQIITNSKSITEHLKRIHPTLNIPILTVENGVDTDLFSPIGDNAKQYMKETTLGITDEISVGIIASLTTVKGHRDFINAAESILKTGIKIKFFIVGDGHLKTKLQDQCQNSGISDNIVFMGRRNDLHQILPLFDIVVSASYSEGTSNTILEAQACGIPVVGTQAGGTPELITHGETGVLIEPGKPDILAKSIITLARDSRNRSRIGNSARQFVEKNFSVNTLVNNTLAVYNS